MAAREWPRLRNGRLAACAPAPWRSGRAVPPGSGRDGAVRPASPAQDLHPRATSDPAEPRLRARPRTATRPNEPARLAARQPGCGCASQEKVLWPSLTPSSQQPNGEQPVAEARAQHPDTPVEVWATDEHRIGLKPILRRV